MAVFKYSGTIRAVEDCYESGTVVAGTEEEAKTKLKPLHLEELRLERLGVLSGILKSFSADVK